MASGVVVDRQPFSVSQLGILNVPGCDMISNRKSAINDAEYSKNPLDKRTLQ